MWILASFCTSQKVPGQTNRAEWCRWGWPACGRGWGVRQLDVGSARVPEALSALQISALLLKLSSYLALKSELWSVLLQDDHVRIWGRGGCGVPISRAVTQRVRGRCCVSSPAPLPVPTHGLFSTLCQHDCFLVSAS